MACNPTVTAEAEEGTGSFQPPDDAGSSPRFFDRPLFGKQALWVKSAPSYTPNPALYADSVYGPRKTKPLTGQHGHLIGEFIRTMKDQGLKVYFQLGAVQPSGLRNEDRPHQPDGSVARIRMADTGCLASPAIRAYNQAYLRDLYQAYPDIDGIRIDWPEYPCYTMGEFFHDFNPHVRQWCETGDFDFDDIQTAVSRLHYCLSGNLTEQQLIATRRLPLAAALTQLADGAKGIEEWLRLKAALSVDTVAHWQAILREAGGDDAELTAHAFMPPYTTATGFDFANVGQHCHAVSAKFYTMHWPLMVKFWSDWIAEANPQLDRREIVRTIAHWMELGTSDEIEERLEQYRYPQPHEPHPIPIDTQTAKLQQVRDRLSHNSTLLVPLVHGYGPTDDFAKRFSTIAESNVDGIWINRYGYLSDEKLAAIGAQESP